jgi:shikimate dehydrogenase
MDWRRIEPRADAGTRLAVLGSPVAHSLSPRMHSAALAALGISGEYHAIDVQSEEFTECLTLLDRCGFSGVNITLPHKPLAATIAKPDDSHVAALGAANAIRFGTPWVCRNFDVAAFLEPLKPHMEGLRGSNPLILGAGATARMAAYALCDQMQIRIWNRTGDRACRLAESTRGAIAVDAPDPAGCSLVVNATSLGLQEGEEPPLIWENLSPGTVVFDLPYRDHATDFLISAEAAGAATIDGRLMLVEQGVASLSWWLGLNGTARIVQMRRAMAAAVGVA